MLKLRSLALELTPRCNQRCAYCYNGWRNGPGEAAEEPTTTEVCRRVDRILAAADVAHMTLTGGEPFMRADLSAIIEHINGRGVPVSIISNGGLVDDPSARWLARRLVRYVQVTLAGPDAERHDALCGTGSFGRTADGVARLVAAGVAVGGSFLCTRHNFATARAVLERMVELGVRHHFAFNRFNPSGHGGRRLRELLPTRSQVLAALAEADRFAASRGLQVHCTMPIPRCMLDEREYSHIRFGQCAAGTDRAEYAVDPQGGVKLCTVQRHTMGSLQEQGLRELILGDAPARFRALIPPFCKPCPHRTTCLGGCGAAAEWVFGRADEVDPFLAQHVMPGCFETQAG